MYIVYLYIVWWYRRGVRFGYYIGIAHNIQICRTIKLLRIKKNICNHINTLYIIIVV